MSEPIAVVGIGADGWAGLAEPGRAAIRAAGVLLGSRRQLDLVPGDVSAERVAWPTPMLPALPGLLDVHDGRSICVLASGDPMLYGVGATLARLVGPHRLHVVPHPSSVALACARLGWPTEDVDVVSLVGRDPDTLHRWLHPGRRLLVLSADGRTPSTVAALLVGRGYGASSIRVLESLGAPEEKHHDATAAEWAGRESGPLSVIAVHCEGGDLVPAVPGLPDGAYEHDGQLTKREIRAVTVARLMPVPGQLLWDVGAGAGSIAIEWCRTHPACRAVAVERDPTRAARVATNARALGVPGLPVVTGAAPAALTALEPPDAVFVGGGVTVPGVLDLCWDALQPGGRLVVNAVTLESETAVAAAWSRFGGDLTRIAISRAAPVGGFTGWRPAMPVTQWAAVKR